MTFQRKPNGKCAVCAHAQRYEIETAIVSGASLRSVGRKHDVHKDALQRHRATHMTPERRAQLVAGPLKPMELAQKAAEKGATLLEHAEIVRNTLMARYLTADAHDDRNGAAALSGRVLDTLRFIAQLTGEVSKASATITNNTLIINSPFMNDLQVMLISRLAPFPQAREAVLEGLQELSVKAMQGPPESPIFIPPLRPQALECVSG